jgi:capsule polysaccharide export protein KpsE/RkpR
MEKAQAELKSYVAQLEENLIKHEREVRECRNEVNKEDREIHDLQHTPGLTQDDLNEKI